MQHTLNVLGLSNESAVLQAMNSAFTSKKHTFPKLAEAYQVATGTTIDPKIDYGSGKSGMSFNPYTHNGQWTMVCP